MNTQTHWRIVSMVLHPMLMPLYFVLFYYTYTMDIILPGEVWYVLITLAVAILAIPGLVLLVLKRLGRVESIGLHRRNERRLPILIVILLLGVACRKLSLYVSVELMTPILGALLSLMLLYISLWWGKISIHAMTAASIATAMFLLLYRWGYTMWESLVPLLLISIIYDVVVIARMELGRHTALQIVLGTALGVLVQLVVFAVLLW